MVALKMILAGSLATDYAVKRFLIEAEAAARLDHPNIVPIYEIGEHDGLHYFSMKFVEGVSLAAITRQLLADPRRTAYIMALVARAVGHAHQRGILHRDLKPSNILIDKAGEPHVTDFGLAKIVAEGREGDGLTMEGSVMGTPSYMAPEQAEGKSATLTTAADIWGLGAILYDCLTAVPPFKGDTALATVAMVRTLEPRHPGAINPDVPADLATICIKCLQKEPNKRYPSADALAQDLENWLEGKPISARPIGRVERTIMWARRRPALAGLAAAVVLSVILGLAGILWQWSEAVTARRAETAARQVAENRAVQLQEQALRIRLQLNRAELLRGRMLMQAGDADRAEGVLWATALGNPWAAERFENPAMPLTAGPFTPAEWALWDLYRQRPREGALPGLRAIALATSPDTTLVAAASSNRLTVKNRLTNRILLEATTTATLLSTPVISSDGKRVAAADYLAGIAYVWDLNPEATETERPAKPLRIFNPPGAVEPVRDPTTGLMTPESLAEAGAAAVLRTNPRIQFMDQDRLLLWNRSNMELRRISTGDLIAKGPGVPDNATPETDVELTLLPPPTEAPADHVALASYGMELRPIRQLAGASAGILEWGLPLPTGDDPRSRGRRPMRLAQAGLDMAIAFQTPAGALVAAASDGTTIVQVQRLSRDEVPRLDHLSLSPDSSTLVGLSARSLYVWSFPDLRLQSVSAVLGGGVPTGVVALSGGEQCLVGEWDQTVAFYSTRSAQPEWLRRQPSVIGGQIFDVGTTGPVGLVSTGDGRSPVQLWTADRPREIARANPREPGFDMALRLTEDGTSLALLTALSVGPAVEIIPFATPNAEPFLVRLELPTVEVAMNLGISASGHVIAAVTSGHLVVLDSNGEGIRQRLYPIPTIATDVSVTDCGTTIAVLMKGRVLLLGRETGTTHTIELAPGQSVYNSTFSDNGQILSAPTGDDVLLISVPEARVIGSLVPGTGGRIVAGAISPKGGLAATVSREGRLGLWDVNTREELASIDLDAGALMQVRFMPGGTRLRWWGEKASGVFDLELGFERLAKNLGDRLQIALPTVVAQAGSSDTLRLVRALRPYAPSAVAETESALIANAEASRN
jgi:WD40 repeat protein